MERYALVGGVPHCIDNLLQYLRYSIILYTSPPPTDLFLFNISRVLAHFHSPNDEDIFRRRRINGKCYVVKKTYSKMLKINRWDSCKSFVLPQNINHDINQYRFKLITEASKNKNTRSCVFDFSSNYLVFHWTVSLKGFFEPLEEHCN